MRRLGPPLAALGLAVAVIEIAAWGILQTDLVSHRAVRVDLDAFAVPPSVEDLAAFREHAWDRGLGFRRRPGATATFEAPKGHTWRYTLDARGARSNPFAGTGGVVAVYGDSFTFGDEVDDDETWPYRLSERLGTAVDNWGHSAWGPDQALLLLRRNAAAYPARAVVLTVLSANLARLANSYRPFLTKRDRMKLGFKPMLRWSDDTLVWEPNPLDRIEHPDDFTRAFRRAREVDYWYAFNARRPAVRFPFAVTLTRALWCQAWACFHPDLFADPRMTARLDRIATELHALAVEHDFRPVLLFIPEPRVLRRFARTGSAAYQDYVRRLRARTDLPRLHIVDLLEHEFDLERFNQRRFKDHASVYGNQVIADVLYPVLRDLPTS